MVKNICVTAKAILTVLKEDVLPRQPVGRLSTRSDSMSTVSSHFESLHLLKVQSEVRLTD